MIEYENLERVNRKLFTEYKTSFDDFLNSGWYILGNSVAAFEQKFAEYHNGAYSVGVASGLDALILSIDALDLPLGSEIIVSSNTYIATILAIIRTGHIPILVEPDIHTYNIDPQKIEEKISDKTRAIVVVHLYGKACEMDPIIHLADRYNLTVIEDTAQAHGAKYKNKLVGTFGIGAFSFYPTKNLGALGDAGAVVTKNEKIYERIKSLRNYGSAKKYYNDIIGYNSRLDEIQAAFLLIKLKVLNDITTHKRELAALYLSHLNDRFIKPEVHDDFYDVYHIFNIRNSLRDDLKKYLEEQGIKTEIHYPVPPHKQKAMQEYIKGDYPISEEIHRTTLSLPISYFHTKDDIMQVIEVMNGWAG